MTTTLPAIKFDRVWDKLSGQSFSTIRSWDAEKEAWYRGLVGREFRVRHVLKPWGWSHGDRTLFKAWLRSVETVVPRGLPVNTLERDVMFGGKPDAKWLLKLMGTDKALLLTFDKKKPVEAYE